MAGKGKSGGGGGSLLLLLVLVLGVGAAGAWNYQRNLEREKQEQGRRPFQGYSDEDLSALAEAYRAEIDSLDRRYRAARGTRSEVRDQGLLGERVREFERIRTSNEKIREATAEVAQREARLAEVTSEQGYRDQASSQSLMLHVGRLTKI
ncbi:MAG: hypothetical protein JRG96_09605 [Deltaproteobacteria bacterium]|nr:hypothetical protein [Deltaproteobacteria bacterium]